MWTTIIGALAAILPAILKLFTGGGDKDQRELGRAEQQNADMKGGIATIRDANRAAQAVESQPEVEHDPNDRSNRR
ncbi:hypothetical protein [Reyranella sp.]|uniref:hypothetical protein n=1 Tax=Reyranella sp. TaxID=1929291 RepID=UPI00272F7F12|nr:hypothetical protein [Reyranella sp.]MDP2377803.1 hypothetical protein [Reyranella sp.]